LSASSLERPTAWKLKVAVPKEDVKRRRDEIQESERDVERRRQPE